MSDENNVLGFGKDNVVELKNGTVINLAQIIFFRIKGFTLV